MGKDKFNVMINDIRINDIMRIRWTVQLFSLYLVSANGGFLYPSTFYFYIFS